MLVDLDKTSVIYRPVCHVQASQRVLNLKPRKRKASALDSQERIFEHC